MKNKEKNGLPEIYKFYKEKYSGLDPEIFIDYKKFSEIIKDFNKELSSLLIEHGAEFKMPARLGSIMIKKYKRKIMLNDDGTVNKRSLRVNWNETKKLWSKMYPGKDAKQLKEIKDKPLVYFLNEHTDGYRFFLYWNKKGSSAKNRSVYSMVFTYTNFRNLAKILKSDNKPDYYE